ncbi:CHAT domain-containing protein [Ephemerocybe angulata]|uniref:CHAT domain-containing protein n=1 Tax=Ephemerocybe angulata TaxID=980116 RepID=A0A8H6HNS6_9AGAR|nr:CHAT domain-containing protein [Tulosesus angulatus]
MTDIIFECADSMEGCGTPLSLTELSIFELPGSDHVKSFVLVNISLGRWEVDERIEISTAGTTAIHCMVWFRNDEGVGFGFIHQDVKEAKPGLMSQRVNMRDVEIRLTMSWKWVEIASESERDPAPDGVVAHLNDRGLERLSTFEKTGELSALADATTMLQQAVNLTPGGHPNLPSYLNNLGVVFTCRFERMGKLQDIFYAIAVQQRAVDLTPIGHARLPDRLNNLGLSFFYRFEQTGNLSDISHAIALQEKAGKLTPMGHADLPDYLSNLGVSFTSRFEQLGEISDLTNAIEAHRKVVKLAPKGHVNLPVYLNNLAKSLTLRFQRTGDLSDIADAIAVQQKGVNLTPTGHADLPARLNNLGSSFTLRFQQTGELSDIVDAFSFQQKAVDLTPTDHADLPRYLSNLGASFQLHFTSSGDIVCLESCLKFYKAAATSAVGLPQLRLDAAKSWARRLMKHRPQSAELIHAFDTALGLVALIAGPEQTVKGRYTQLENTSGLALEAAAAACALDRPDKALEWLEQGRCLVWSQLNHLRTPLDNLGIHNHTLAQIISNVSKALETAGSSRGQSHVDMPLAQKISMEDEARTHLVLAEKRDKLLKTARAIPGFEFFLMPLPCSAIMQHLPESGPIVVINIDSDRCDVLALLAGMDEPLHIPLPNFSTKKASMYRSVLESQLRGHNFRSRELEPRGARPLPNEKRHKVLPMHQVLRGLFEEVVKPVLDALAFSKVDRTTGKVPPRLWWCPTGPLSFLPLHAAGIYQGSNQESVFDYVVSSYTPTVTALTDRVKSSRLVDSKGSGLFLTSQPSVPGACSIPGTTKEVRSIFERAEESGVKVLKMEGDEMTVGECLERMQEFSCIHLACHGEQNAAEPLQSRFLFHQGSLELGTILKSNLRHADLAFLSACQTSTGQETLSDEAVHLAAGMLAAGYRRVVGTMWSIGDKAGQDVATSFYEYLFTRRGENTVGAFDGTHSAVALHHATQTLRLSLDDSERSLLTWIPFVHFGL